MFYIVLHILLLLPIFALGKNPYSATSIDSTAQVAVTLLDSAFRNNSSEIKTKFFEQWHQYSDSLSVSLRSTNDTITGAIQFIFKDIFYPNLDTNRYFAKRGYINPENNKEYIRKNIQWNGCFISADYFILNPYVTYYVYPNSIFWKLSKRDTLLKHFTSANIMECVYPNVTFLDKEVLYLTKDYYSVLVNFINIKNEDSVHLKYMADDKRMFLSPQIEISKAHDGWFYHYETFPVITSVRFNSNYTAAYVEFRSSFNTGGYARYSKNHDQWRRDEFYRESWVQ